MSRVEVRGFRIERMSDVACRSYRMSERERTGAIGRRKMRTLGTSARSSSSLYSLPERRAMFGEY